MKRSTKIVRLVLLALGVVAVLFPYLLPFQNLLQTALFSALCFTGLAISIFFIPKSKWTAGLISAIPVFLSCGMMMPVWGRIWYGEDGQEDWKIMIPFFVMALNVILPAIRGFRKTAK